MSQATESTLADPQRVIANLQRQLDERTAERDALRRELADSREQQTATAEVLQVINSSPGDLQPVFEAILEKAHTHCGATRGALLLFDGETFRGVAMHSYPQDRAEQLRRGFSVRESPLAARLLAGDRFVHIADVRLIDAQEERAAAERGGVRTCLLLALRKDGALLGMISCNRGEVRPFSAKEIAFLENFAAQAVIAMENARLLGELQSRTHDLEESLEYQTATSDVLNVISRSTADVQPVLDTVTETAARLCGADDGAIYIREGEVYRAVSSSFSAAEPELWAIHHQRTLVPGRDSVVGQVALEGRVVHIADIRADPDYAVPEAVASGRRTVLGVPLLRDSEPIGVIGLTRNRVEPFTERQIELVRTFADQAVIAMENARLLGELQTRTRDLEELLEYQTATSDVLKVISRSTFDLQPILDTLVETGQRLCDSDTAALLIREGDVFRVVASRSLDPAYDAFIRARTYAPGRESVTSRVALAGEVVHVPDITADPDYRFVETVTLGKLRTVLGVPLLREREPIGIISLCRQRVEPFTERQIELVRTFADQAVIAIENTRLLTELRKSLEQQTATAEVLQVINSSPGELQPVFETMLEKAMRLCEAAFGLMRTYDGQAVRLVASQGLPPRFAEFAANPANQPGAGRAGGATPRFLAGAHFVHHPDLKEEEAYRSGDPYRVALVELGGARTMLVVPLRKDGAFLGQIAIYRQEVRPYSDKQIALLQSFAAQAVIAMENARLLGELQARTRDLEESLEYQTATSDVLNVISRSTADVQPVLDTVAETATRLCGADTASITIRQGEVYRFVSSSASAAEPEWWAIQRQRTIVPGRDSVLHARVALEGRVVHVADALADPDYAFPESIASGRRTMLGVPLLRDSEAIGVIGLSRKRVEPFTERQIELVRTFADQAVIAMENARLLSELQARTRDLEQSLEYQTATSDVLKVISRSTSDVQPVLDTLVKTAVRLCGADAGSIAIREGEVYRYVSAPLADAEYWATLRQRTIVPGRDSIVARVALEGRVVQIADIRADPDYAPEVVAAGRRTVLGVPLLRGSEPIGVITLNRHRVEPFTERQIELIRTFADQAVIAMENARLLGELQARTDELTRSVAELQALEEVLRAVNSSLDLDTVLANIISRAVRLSQADEGTIYEFDEAEEVFVPKSAFGMSAERVEGLRERRVRMGETHLGRAAVERAPVHVEDVQQDPTMIPDVIGGLLRGIHAVLAVPLLREDKLVGGLVIRRRTAGGFAPTIPTLLQTFAGQAVLAIENARLFQELMARGEEARRARTAAEAALADLRRAQDRLIQSEKMASLGQLTAGIAHEIKNPLNFVNNFAGLSVELLDELKETAAPAIAGLAEDERADVDEIVGMLTGNLEKIAEHGRRADGIVKSMLEHSRGVSGERREIDLNTLVDEALNLAYHGARAQDASFNITLERDLDPAAAPIELAPQEMTRVFLNLFGNGFYAANKRACGNGEAGYRPTLSVSTRDLGQAVEVRVRDNGTGIPREIRDQLFQPFFTTKPTGEGTGLGLSISWDIVTQQHGGTITVDSREGEFTEFTIRLPRNSQAAGRGA